MKVLIIGGGGREHALAWKISQSPVVKKIYVAPGNGGTALDNNIENIDITDVQELISFSIKQKIDLTVVGPEAPLAIGIVDAFRKNNLAIFGPTKAAAQLESSKEFSKIFMARHNIPTAKFATFKDTNSAHDYLQNNPAPIVIKADGLASGKGVVVAMTDEEAHEAVDSMLSEKIYGSAGTKIIIEEFLEGEEASFIVICDGSTILPLDSSQDHKRLLDNDAGPNTGGMGAYSPAPLVTDEVNKKIMDQVIIPTIEGMKQEGIEFSGFLYAGIIVDPYKNIKTLEFNCRMGDPETQPLLFRMQSDLFTVLFKAAKQELEGVEINWDNEHAITIVMAAKDYPTKPILGDEINLPEMQNEDTFIFHAGTSLESNKLMTSGGRVLGITAKGKTLEIAKNKAYDILRKVELDGAQFRTDIGKKALN
ncbi:phosphoribosylamine--glycine ligase [Methylophilaceae bacterium]|nr:phosphoribosylamine--glycine ligase [Methylophilaceae bacterium]